MTQPKRSRQSTPKLSKTITLQARDAAHVYEWLIGYWQGDENAARHGGCYECQRLAARLVRVIGEREARRIRQVVAKNPGARSGRKRGTRS